MVANVAEEEKINVKIESPTIDDVIAQEGLLGKKKNP